MQEIKKLIQLMTEEMESVRVEDESQKDELDEYDNGFNAGWYSGMARALNLIAELEVK